jgi:CubicO group peptidase (beta-lactamase class C family)
MLPRKRNLRHLQLLLLLLALVPARIAAQPAPLQGFDAYVAQAVADWGPPGLAIAVVKDGEVVFARGYGVLELGGSEPVTEHTRFAIGSTTKAITAAAVGILVDEGKLTWDDRVIQHLPDFQLSDPYVTREIRIRDLLSHRAGLGNADYLWYGQDQSTEEIIRKLRYVEPAYSMRAGYVYQNIMFATAGELTARVSGMPWTAFVRTRILEPLGMTETAMTLAELDGLANVAAPHDVLDGELQVIGNASVDAVAAAGSIWSSVGDMAKWIRMLLAGGELPDGSRLLRQPTFATLFTAHNIIPRGSFYPTARLTEPHWTTYALGWFQADYQGRATDFHTGSIDGMVAICGLIRDENLGVYVLANRDHTELRHALMYRVFDLYGEEAPRDWSAELKELYDGMAALSEARSRRSGSERVEGTTPSLELQAYAGTYSDRLYGTVEVSWINDALYLEYGPGLKGPMEHWHYDTFRVLFEAAWRGWPTVSFTLDARGRPATLTLSGREYRREW